MATTKITSFPSLHSDQGHGLTKVQSPQKKQQITKQKQKTKERLKVDQGNEVISGHVSSKMWSFSLVFFPYCDVRFDICDADLWGDIATPSTPRCAAIKFVIRFPQQHISSSYNSRFPCFVALNQVSLTFMHHLNYKCENFQRGDGGHF